MRAGVCKGIGASGLLRTSSTTDGLSFLFKGEGRAFRAARSGCSRTLAGLPALALAGDELLERRRCADGAAGPLLTTHGFMAWSDAPAGES